MLYMAVADHAVHGANFTQTIFFLVSVFKKARDDLLVEY